MEKLRVIELFAGIGCQAEGLRRANIPYEVLGISEIDKYAFKGYEAIHGKTINFGDITKINQLPECDLLTYSSPCQDISTIGKQKGLEEGSHTRSSLLWEVKRLLLDYEKRNCLPKFLMLENVTALVGQKFYPDFLNWVDFLSTLGYRNFWKVLDATDYGIPQTRKRVIMISVHDIHSQYDFPAPIQMTKFVNDFLEPKNIIPQYVWRNTKCVHFFIDEKPHGDGNYIRAELFRPIMKNSKYAHTITTNPQRYAANENTVGVYVSKRDVIPTKEKNIYTLKENNKIGILPEKILKNLHNPESDKYLKFRILTPRESLRLMGWHDDQINRLIASGLSKTQLYKVSGNGIVIDVLQHVFSQLPKITYDNKYYQKISLF